MVAHSNVLPTYARSELAFDHGKGVYLYTQDNEQYLDFTAGIAVSVLGHSHPHLVETLKSQGEKLWHTSNIFTVPEQERLAKRLCEASFADRVFFTNSGTEAIECAIKMARKYFSNTGQPEKYELITFEGAFHGRSLAAIAAGGQEKYLEGFGPVTPGFAQVTAGDIDAVEAAISEKTAGFLIEPVQGEGGVRAIDTTFLKALRELADKQGLLLVFDEIQCGMGRTGKLFAHEWAGIEPDIMAVAKALGGGFPVGACMATEKAATGMTVGTHGSTYGGNPLAMAMGNAVLDIILEPEFMQSVEDKCIRFAQKLARLKDEAPHVIEEVRGKGLMVGLKVKVPNTEIISRLRDKNMLAVGAGDNVVRLVPPLIVSDEELDEALNIIGDVCGQYSNEKANTEPS